MRVVVLSLCLLSFPLVPFSAQAGSGPTRSSSADALPIPVDHAFHGAIHLAIVADTKHGIFHITESIPVPSPGEMVLYYPEWETTSHSATASVLELAGLHIEASGQEQSWRRDPFNVHAFRVQAPAGTTSLQLRFDYLPKPGGEIRPEMIDVQWQRMVLYPAGWYARNLPVVASLRLPADLHAVTALRLAKNEATPNSADQLLTFTPAVLDQLVDAPVYAARYVRQIDLGSTSKHVVQLDLLADAEADLTAKAEALNSLRTLLSQTEKVFGPPPFSRYEMLVSLSDELFPGGGREHLEEGENNMPASFFTDYEHQIANRDLIAHEYVHAWNGRYRQPAGLWSPTFNQPTDPSLLWVYEGQTEFWGRVLAARSGMRSYQQTLDKLALDASLVANRPGREWKNLADSTLDALYMPGHPIAWREYQRREDYYPEGVLLWLDVDAHLQELSSGTIGIDEFARRFFAVHDNPTKTSTYTFEDVCATLNALAPSDWKSFFQLHLLTHHTADVMTGLTGAGWRLTYTSAPTEAFLQQQTEAGVTDLTTSVGFQITDNGVIKSVLWNGPAFRAGIAPTAQVTEVNGRAFTPELLLSAIRSSTQTKIRLSVKMGASDQELFIPYEGSLRYPHLERIPGTQDFLTPLLAPR
jgi:predicted metalloprotease with PDZ domain